MFICGGLYKARGGGEIHVRYQATHVDIVWLGAPSGVAQNFSFQWYMSLVSIYRPKRVDFKIFYPLNDGVFFLIEEKL